MTANDGHHGETQDQRTPRPVRMFKRIYRVIGYQNKWAQHVTTWEYSRLSDAEWRANDQHRLVDFSYADVEWKPMPSSHNGRSVS